MQKIDLRCGDLSAVISTIGAEVVSFSHDRVGELIWQPSPESWRRQAPVLFPMIGRAPPGVVMAGGSPLQLPPHGLAPEADFAIQSREADRCTLMLTGDAETDLRYPYAYRLAVEFVLGPQGLDMRIEVRNPSDDIVLPYMLGGHPGLKFPLPGAGAAEDHLVRFSHREESPLVVVDGNRDGRAQCHHFDGWQLRPLDLSFAGFTQGVAPVSSDSVVYGTDRLHLKLRMNGFSNLAFWRLPNAAFFCIEPWSNLPFPSSAQARFDQYHDVSRLEPGAIETYVMRIEPGGTIFDGGPQSSEPKTPAPAWP